MSWLDEDKKTRRPRVCVDMDDTMADTMGEHIARYNAEHGLCVTKDDLQGKWLWDHVPKEHQQDLMRIMCAEDFFEDLDVLPDAPAVLQRLQEHYDIFIATAAMEVPSSFASKFRWLKRHFPFLPYRHFVFCGDKSILRAEYLIDDMPRYLKAFDGQGILFSAPHNVGATGFPRVENWLEVEEYLLPGGVVRS
ncbi:MAG TPA: 5'-3'-deoxyribonucleotidase [Acidobacteriaceae bacterium]